MVIENCGYPNGEPTATITGGTFVSSSAKEIASYAKDELELAKVTAETDAITIPEDEMWIENGEGGFDLVKAVIVTFNAEDGEPEPEAQKIEKGTKAEEPAEPEKEGYTFAGWFAEGAETAFDFETEITEDTELTAKWTAKKFWITFVNDDEKQTELYSYEAEYDTMPEYGGETPEKDDEEYTYTFAGWTPVLEKVTDEATYKAVYTRTADTYTLTWDVDGYTVDVKYDFGAEITEPSTPTKNGFTFAGWNPEVPEAMPARDLTITATWKSTAWELALPYTPGTLTDTGAKFENLELVFSPADPSIGRTIDAYWVGYKFIAPEAVTAENIVNSSYSNDGGKTWKNFNNAKDGQETDGRYYMQAWVPLTVESVEAFIEAGQTMKWTYKFAWDGNQEKAQTFEIEVDPANVTLSKNEDTDPQIKTVDGEIVDKNEYFDVTFDSDGGSAVEAQNVRYNAKAAEPTAPTKKGYTFDRWYLGEAEYDFTAGVKSELELKAAWTANEYTIQFVDSDETTVLAEITQDFGTAITAPENPTKTGYTFSKWETEIPETMPAENLTIKAEWNAITYTIAFNGNNDDATGEMAGLTAKYDEEVQLTENAYEVTNYHFAGWATEADGTVAYGDAVKVKNLTSADKEIVTLYAVWTQNDNIDITYSSNGAGQDDVIQQTVYLNVATNLYGETETAFSREGYILTGWNTKAGGDGDAYEPTQKVTLSEDADIKLYAVWTKAEASITNGDGTTYYKTLADAVKAAKDGETVKVLEDLEPEARVDVDKSITIDLNGKTIKPQSSSINGSAFNIKSGTVSITNGTIDGRDVEEVADGEGVKIADGICLVTVRSGAELNLGDGIEMIVDSQNGCCVYPFDGGKVNISGGTYTNTTDEPYQYREGFQGLTINQANTDAQLIQVTGGTFNGNDPQLGDDSGAKHVNDGYVAIEQAEGSYLVVEGYIVTFDTNGGEPAEIEEQRVRKNGQAVMPEEPTNEGLVFAGWLNGETAFEFQTPITANLKLKAEWKTATWDVVFNAVTYKVTLTVEDGATLDQDKIPVVEIPGTVFAGWFTYGEETDEAGNQVKVPFDVTQPITSDLDVYPNIVAPVTVRYLDEDEETVLLDEVVVGAGSAAAAIRPESDPEKEYYEFAGWFVKNEKGELTEYDFEKMTVDTVLTRIAQWKDTVTFMATLNLADYTGIYVYIHIPEGEDPSEYTVKCSADKSIYAEAPKDVALTSLDVSNRKRGSETLSFYQVDAIHAASCEMTDITTVTLLKNGETVKTESYSVRDMAEERLASGEYTGTLEKIHKALLQYGYYGQMQFKNGNADMSIPEGAPALKRIPDSYAISGDPTNFSKYITKFEARADLAAAVSMNIYLTPAKGYSLDDFTITVTDKNGKRYKGAGTPVMDGKRIYFKIGGMLAPQIGRDFKIKVTLKSDKTKTATWTRSVMRIVYNTQQNATSDTLRNLVQSLYQYYLAATELWPTLK